MAKITFGNTLEIPRDLVTVAQTTGNDILDLGYQCKDMHPYFKFTKSGKTDKYTKIHPNNCTSSTTVNVYHKDGSKMVYQGTGTQTGASLFYASNTYANNNNAYEDIRENRINKWSKHKPVEYNSSNILTDSQKKSVNWGINFSLMTKNTLSNLINALDSAGSGDALWQCTLPTTYYRLSDFNGYNKDATMPFKYCIRNYSDTYQEGDSIYIANFSDGDVDFSQSDFSVLNGAKVGVALKNINNGVIEAVCTEDRAPLSGFGLPLPSAAIGKTYNVYYFFTDKSFNSIEDATTGTYVACPSDIQTITVINRQSPAFNAKVKQFSSSNGNKTINFKLDLIDSSYSVVLGNVKLELYYRNEYIATYWITNSGTSQTITIPKTNTDIYFTDDYFSLLIEEYSSYWYYYLGYKLLYTYDGYSYSKTCTIIPQ